LAWEYSGLVKRFGRRKALDGLDMAVPRGTVCGLVGSNGAGKTTTMSIIAGITHPTRGEVNVLGEGRFDPGRHAGRVSLLPQDSDLPRYARLMDLLVFYAELQGMPRRKCRDAVMQMLEWVNLSDRAGSSVRSLSHGMKRRVTIAQAFLGEPELILLDEPLSGLDPKERINIRNILRDKRGKQTVIVSSHNLHEIELICDHVAFIEHGRTIRQDSMTDVTGADRVLQYVVEPGDVPAEKIRGLLPGVTIEVDEGCITCKYDEKLSPVRVNEVVLRALLDAGVGIIRVQQGSGLETAYMTQAG
jgi:ABC-2 type transport system ATP-binding protein